MPAWRYHVIAITVGLTILFGPLFFPSLLYVYGFLLFVFGVAAFEHAITIKVYSIIKRTREDKE